jgi:hypothetical protein
MSDFSQATLVASAGIDPWKLRDQFTAGDPEEIYAMARGFNQAAAQQGDAVTLATKGLETAGDGYKVNNQTPIDVDAQVAQASKDLGNNGEKLGKIAKLLSETASDLSQRTAKANTQITSLTGDVNAIIGEWNQFVRQVHNDPDYQHNLEQYRAPYVARAVQKVKDYGTPLKQSVSDYEKYLADHLKAMADLGYIPPNQLDEGPGDVDVPDPTAAGKGTVAATKMGDPAAGKAAFAQNTQYLDLLNAKQKAGVPLTEAEKNWLKAYYEEVTPHFGEIKDWADKQLGIKPGHKPDQKDPFVQLVSRVGDGFLNLSQNVPYDELPKSARDILASDLGVNGAVSAFNDDKERRLGSEIPPKADPALLAAAGFTGLLNDYSSDGVAPSNDLASHMKDAALRWKHQINVMYANYKTDFPALEGYQPGAKELTEAQWNALMPDELASDALGVVARNRPFTNNWIVNDAAGRREVMGMNWQSGQGAADVLLSASLRGPGLTDQQAAQAGLAIVQDAASSYHGLAEMANKQVKGAIGSVGMAYIDSFAQFDTGKDEVITITLPDGSHVSGFRMDADTRANFLKFVADSDKDVYEHFREGTLVRGTDYLKMTMAAGHTDPHDPEYIKAMNLAVRLTASTDAAAAAVLLDIPHDAAHADELKKQTEDLAYGKAMSDYNVKKGYVDQVNNMFSLVGLVTLPTGVGTAVNVGSTAFGFITDATITQPEAPDQNGYISNLQQYVQELAGAHTADDAAQARVQDNIIAMTVNANTEAGHPLTYVDADGHRVPVTRDSDGQWPEDAIANIYNNLPNYTADLGDYTINKVVGADPAGPDGHGGGSNTHFSTTVSGTQPDQVGSLADSGGSWTDPDDQYRIYYGDESRWTRHEATTWDPPYKDQQVPDNKADTKTVAPVVPAAAK